MKKILLALCILNSFGCGSYPLTSFYVKNTSDKQIDFNATVIKHSQATGPYKVDQSFSVKPMDSVLARRIGFKTNGQSPQNWFTEFNIRPIEGAKFNDPKTAENWKKTMDKNGKPVYTFSLTN